MNHLALVAVLLAASHQVQEDGSLLILKNSNKPVSAFTDSDITHIAVVVRHGDTPWVYEATPAKVRRVTMSEYLREIAELNRHRTKRTRVLLLQPKRSYSDAERANMLAYMQSELGRRYSIKGYVRDRRSDGIHCAEFATRALAATGRFRVPRPAYAISPAEFYGLVAKEHDTPVAVSLPAVETTDSWCWRSWKGCLAFSSWCSWACYETWTFCR